MPSRTEQVKREIRVVKVNSRKDGGRLKTTELIGHGRLQDAGDASHAVHTVRALRGHTVCHNHSKAGNVESLGKG